MKTFNVKIGDKVCFVDDRFGMEKYGLKVGAIYTVSGILDSTCPKIFKIKEIKLPEFQYLLSTWFEKVEKSGIQVFIKL